MPPVVDFDPARFKIAAEAAAVGLLGSRPDLPQMDPVAFERLVRELFTATEHRGIDALIGLPKLPPGQQPSDLS